MTTTSADYSIERADATEVRPLQEALVGSTPIPQGIHVVVRHDGTVIGVASVRSEPLPERPGGDAWRLTGVGVEFGHRGRGVGGALVERCLSLVGDRGGDVVWCRAPAGAYGFFKRYGLERSGDPITGVDGPEYLLAGRIAPLRRSWSLAREATSPTV